ncbi:MAG: hypothetical protein QOI10_1471 [Solirubrobacterales bacterium]|jgi:hypothetical protein|nr:hypothetical protein [Solirubrobacterales bacterium]
MSEPRFSTRLRLLALIAACVASLGLAACGGGDGTSASTTSTTTPTGATGGSSTGVDASNLRDQFNKELLQLLTTTQDMSRSQAQCTIDALEATVSDKQLRRAIEEAARTGQTPQDLINQAFDAGAQCPAK